MEHRLNTIISVAPTKLDKREGEGDGVSSFDLLSVGGGPCLMVTSSIGSTIEWIVGIMFVLSVIVVVVVVDVGLVQFTMLVTEVVEVGDGGVG